MQGGERRCDRAQGEDKLLLCVQLTILVWAEPKIKRPGASRSPIVHLRISTSGWSLRCEMGIPGGHLNTKQTKGMHRLTTGDIIIHGSNSPLIRCWKIRHGWTNSLRRTSGVCDQCQHAFHAFHATVSRHERVASCMGRHHACPSANVSPL